MDLIELLKSLPPVIWEYAPAVVVLMVVAFVLLYALFLCFNARRDS